MEAQIDQLNTDFFFDTPFQFRFGGEGGEATITGFILDTNITLDLCQERANEKLISALMMDNNNHHNSKNKRSHLNIILGHSVSQKSESQLACADYPFYPQFGGGSGDTVNSLQPSIYVEYQVLLQGRQTIGGGVPVIAHEIGHWLGLLHPDTTTANVVEDNPCNVRNINDFVKDTPTQLALSKEDIRNATAGMTADVVETYDSCPDQPGTDSIWNIMNKFCRYANCGTSKQTNNSNNNFTFTQGQIQRMYNFWLIWHEQNETCTIDDDDDDDDDYIDYDNNNNMEKEEEGLIPILVSTARQQHNQHQQQYLFSMLLPVSYGQYDHQVIVYDQYGTEVFNAYESFTFYQQGSNDVTIDLCLSSKEEPYVVVVVQSIYDTTNNNFDYQQQTNLPQFAIDGKVIVDAFPNKPQPYLGGWLHSFLLEEVTSSSSSYHFTTTEGTTTTTVSRTSSLLKEIADYDPTVDGGGSCPLGELLMEITHFDDWAWIAIFSPQADPMFLSEQDGSGSGGGLYCLQPSTKPEPFTVLIASLGEEQTGSPPPPSLEVKLDGETILRKEWPYYELFGSYRILSALITADQQTLALQQQQQQHLHHDNHLPTPWP